MSELDEALRAAVESIGQAKASGAAGRAHSRPDSSTRAPGDDVVLLHRAPAGAALRAMHANHVTFAEMLRAEFRHGEILAGLWLGIREGLYMLLLFWVAAVLLAFGQTGGEVTMPLFGTMSVVDASFVTALVIRVVLLGGASLNHALDRRVDSV